MVSELNLSDGSSFLADKQQSTQDLHKRMLKEVLSGSESGMKLSSSSELQTNIAEISSHLAAAQKACTEQGIVSAVSEYRAAIDAADRLDQRKISLERDDVEKRLSRGDLDVQTRRDLVKQDAELTDMQRAPGIARANFAAALLKSGELTSGIEMLLDAQSKYPQGGDDQFRRYLTDTLKSVPDRHPGISVSDRASGDQRVPTNAAVQPRPTDGGVVTFAPPGSTGPVDVAPSSPAPPVSARPTDGSLLTPAPTEPSTSSVGAAPPVGRGDGSAAPPSAVPEVPPLRVVPGQPGGRDAAAAPEVPPPAPAAPPRAADVAPPAPAAPPRAADVAPPAPSAPTDGAAARPATDGAPVQPTTDGQVGSGQKQPLTPVESVMELSSQGGALTDDKKHLFDQAIAQADAQVSSKTSLLMQMERDASQALERPSDVDGFKKQNAALQETIFAMPADKQGDAAALLNQMDKALTPDQRNEFREELLKKYPELGRSLELRDQAMGEEYILNLTRYNAIANDLQAELNQAALTRYYYAEALARAGDQAGAKKYIADAVKVDNGSDPAFSDALRKSALELGKSTHGSAAQSDSSGRAASPTAKELFSKAFQDFDKEAGSDKTTAATALTKYLPEFVLAQNKSDDAFKELAHQDIERDKKLKADIGAKLTPDVQADLSALSSAISSNKLSQGALEALETYEQPTTSEERRKALAESLNQDPSAKPVITILQTLERKVGRDTLEKLRQLDEDQGRLQEALTERFSTRMQLANLAMSVGNVEVAKEQFNAAFKTLPPDLQLMAAKEKNIQELASGLNIDLTTLPMAPDAALAEVTGPATSSSLPKAGENVEPPAPATSGGGTPGDAGTAGRRGAVPPPEVPPPASSPEVPPPPSASSTGGDGATGSPQPAAIRTAADVALAAAPATPKATDVAPPAPVAPSVPTDGAAARPATDGAPAQPAIDGQVGSGQKLPLTPVEAVMELSSKGGELDEKKRQLFDQAIAEADAQVSSKTGSLMQMERIASQALERPNDIDGFKKQNAALQQTILAMPADKQGEAAALLNQMDKALTPEERKGFRDELLKKFPEQQFPQLKASLDLRDQAMGEQYILNLTRYNSIENDLQAELNQAALTRYIYADALAKAGDQGGAKKYIADAVKVDNGSDPAFSDAIRRFAAELGVNPDRDQLGRPSDGSAAETESSGRAASPTAKELFSKAFQDFDKEAGADKATAANALKKYLPEFALAQNKSDEAFKELAHQDIERDKKLKADIDAKLTPDVQADLTELSKMIDSSNFSPGTLAALQTYEQPTTSEERRKALAESLSQDPSAKPVISTLQRIESKVGRDTLEKVRQLDEDQRKLQDALSDRFATRMQLANLAMSVGNVEVAKEQFNAAFKTLSPDLQLMMAKDKSTQELASGLNIDLKTLPMAPDAVLADVTGPGASSTQPKAGENGEPSVPATTGGGTSSDAAPAAGSTQAKPEHESPDPSNGTRASDAQPDLAEPKNSITYDRPENNGLRPDQVRASALQALKENKTDEAIADFKDAIKGADASYTEEDKKLTDQLIEVVRTGKKQDGSQLTEDERAQAHQLINLEFSKAAVRIQYREDLALVLASLKQNASAEKVHNDSIAEADKLPIKSMQAEFDQLTSDIKNNKFSKATSIDMLSLSQTLQGSGISKDDGLLYLPIVTRKSAASFYLSGIGGNADGLIKPEEAMKMVDAITAKEKELYNIDEKQLKTADPSLAQLVQVINPLLPKNLKEEKKQKDAFWSNVLVDVGTTSAVVAITGVLASIATRNPEVADVLIQGGKLTRVGAVAATVTAGAAIGADIALRHGLNQAITGHQESWTTSAIHGAAGMGSMAAMLGTRAVLGKLLYGGASAETVVPKLIEKYGLTASAEGTTPTVGEFIAQLSKTDRLPESIMALKNSDAPLIGVNGKVDGQLAGAMDSTYSQAQLSELARTARKAPDYSNMSWQEAMRARGSSAVDSLRGHVPGLVSGWSTGASALSTYGLISALDRPVDPVTGKQLSYLETLRQSQYRSGWENTAVDALWMAPMLRDGAVAKRFFPEGKGIGTGAWNVATAPFSASTFGSLGRDGLASSEYWRTGLQVAQLNVNQALLNAPYWMNGFQGVMESRQIGAEIHAVTKPIQDEHPPQDGSGKTP